MKNKFYFLLAFASMLMFGSCSEDKEVKKPEPEPVKKVQLTASFESKSFGTSVIDNSLLWSQNDQIAVLGENVIEPFTLSNGAETGTGNFMGYMPDGAKGVVFPYIEEKPASISGGKLSMTLPNAITDITKCNLPMWSSLGGTTVTFKHLVGLLAISVNDIPSGCTQLVLETSNAIAGDFIADLSADEVVLAAASGNTADDNKKISITFDEIADDDNDRLFYIPLPVGSYSSVKVSLVVGGEMEALEEWSSKVIERAKIYSASLTYTSVDGGTSTSITSALDEQFKDEEGGESVAPEDPVQIDLTSEVTATADPIVIPTAAEGSSSDITMNFYEAPVTSADLPLVLEQNKDAEVGESVNALAVNMKEDAVIENMSINAPTTTVSLNGGSYKALTAKTGLNTLVVGSDVEINDLTIEGGNIRILSGGKITLSIKNESGQKVTIILEEGATIENSLPAGVVTGDDFLVINPVEDDLRQAVAQGGTVVLSEDVELYNPLEITNEVTIDLNGKSVKNNYSSVFVVLKGGDLTLNDANNTAVVWGSETNGASSSAVWAKGGNVTINGGIYKVGDNNGGDQKYNICIYAGNAKVGEEYLLGNITINGGLFEYTGTVAEGADVLLKRASTDSKIVVKGGKFKKFNPGDWKYFIHSDYESVLVEGTTDWYEVVIKAFTMNESGEYEIRSVDGLFVFAAMVEAGETFAGKTIKLAADLDLKDRPWTPIGAARTSVDNKDVIFQGNFDGQNHTIKNMVVNTNEYRFLGLFATTHNATIQNVTFVDGEVKATDCSFTSVYAGAVVGYARGTYIINCHNKGCAVTVTRSDDQRGGWIGGIVGGHTYWDGINPVCIACTNSATITSPYIPSGIAGGTYGGKVSYVACFNTGEIVLTGTYNYSTLFAAGVVGEMAGENYMYGCFSDCTIPNHDYSCGALTGDAMTNAANIHYSYSTVTNVSLLGQCFSQMNGTVGVVSSYNEAVDKLNKGIELYNWSAEIPCEYIFEKGDTPSLVFKEASTNSGIGADNWGNGGKF